MRNILLTLFALLYLGLGLPKLQAQSQTYSQSQSQPESLFVKEKSGAISAYSLGNIEKISFSSGNLIINQIDNDNVVYSLSSLQHLTFSDTTSVAVEKEIITDNGLIVYPNPVKDILYIDFSGTVRMSGTISILSLEGKVLTTQIIEGDGVISVDISHLTHGVYFCHFLGSEVHKPVKFIKQ